MKKLFTALLLLVGFAAFSQSTGYFRYDSVRFEKVGGNSEFILLNSTRDSIGVLFNMGNGRTRFRTLSSLGLSPNVKNGIRKSVDTLMLGDSLDRYTYIQAASSYINNSPYRQLRIGNRSKAESLNGLIPDQLLMNTYTPVPFSIEGLYGDQWGDIDTTFYGGLITTIKRVKRDSTGSLFTAGVRKERLAGGGGEFIYQWFPQRDSSDIIVGRDGQSGNTVFGQLDIGDSYGYNIYGRSESTMPGFPITSIRSSIDLSRVSDNTRRKKMTGSGVSGFTSMYKTYQTSINMSTYEAGNYTDSVFGYQAYGDAYPQISGATKAKTLAVWDVKNAYGFYAHPQYRYTNTVRNGYAFYAGGDSDQNRFNYVRIGGAASNFLHQLEVTGDVVASDTVKGFITGGMGMFVNLPLSVGSEAGINFGTTDSIVSGAVYMAVAANRDARYLGLRAEGLSSAAYPDNSNGLYIRFETGGNHANVSRVNRNGNWTLGNSAAILAFRYWKKLAVDGGGVFRDTLRLEVAPLQVVDSTNYKVVARHVTTGDLVTMPWIGGGGAGGGTDNTNVGAGFRWLKPAAQEIKTAFGGYGITWDSTTNTDGLTATIDTATTFAANRTSIFSGIPDTRILFSNAGLRGHSSQLTFTGQALQLASTNTTQATTSSALAQTYNSLTTGTGQYLASTSLSSGTGLHIDIASTAASSNTQTGLKIDMTGTNGTASMTSYGARIDNSHGGTTPINVGLAVGASGAATASNIGLLVRGNIATSATAGLEIEYDNAGNQTRFRSWERNGATYKGVTWAVDNFDIVAAGATRAFHITNQGRVAIRNSTTSTAYLHLGASTASASTASLKINEGTRQTTPEDGTINYVSNNLEFTETSTVYTLAKTLRASASLDFVSTASGNSSELTITVTGAATGDPVALSIPHALATGGTCFTAWVSSTNTVTVRFNNYSGSAVDPGSDSFTVAVLHY